MIETELDIIREQQSYFITQYSIRLQGSVTMAATSAAAGGAGCPYR